MAIPTLPAHGAPWDSWATAVDIAARGAAQIRPPTLMGMGDSLTANGGNDYVPATGGGGMFYAPQSWHLWGHLISGARFLHMGNAATPGYTIQQAKTTHLPTVLAAKPTYCTVLAGQNNISALSAQDYTDLFSIYTQLVGAGITPILCTIPPTSTNANLHALNRWIARISRDNGWPLLDLFGALVVPSTGLYLAADTADGVHPTETGAKKMGQALSTLMQQLLPVPSVRFASSNVGQTIPSNPLFLNAPGSDGWFPATTTTAGSSATGATSGVVGNAWTITRPADADNFWGQNSVFPTVAGSRLIVAVKVSSSVRSVGGSAAILLNDAVGNSRVTVQLNEDIPAGSALAFDYHVPSGLPDYALRFQLRASGATGASLTVAQFTADVV